MFHGISITYYAFMSVYIPFTRAAVSELCIPGVFMMGDKPDGGTVSGTSNPSGPGSGPTSGIGRGSGSGTGRASIPISDICNPPGPDTETDAPMIRPIAERPTRITYDSKGKAIHPYATRAEMEWDGDISPNARDKDIGPIRVYDPNNQNFVYREGETNQPLAKSTATSLEDLHKKGIKLHDDTFDTKQKGFFRNVLHDEDREMYDKIYTTKRGKPATKPD